MTADPKWEKRKATWAKEDDPKPLTREEVEQLRFRLIQTPENLPTTDFLRLCADWLRMEARIREMGEELSNCPERAHEEFFEEAEPPVKKEVDK